MSGVVVIDTNLLILLIVGAASKDYIALHKRLDDYTLYDFELLTLLIEQFSEIVLLPHILAEVSNLARHIENPARRSIQSALRTLVEGTIEFPIQSLAGVSHGEYDAIGLTDAVILSFCGMSVDGIAPTLLTPDTKLANRASALGYSVIDYRQEYQSE